MTIVKHPIISFILFTFVALFPHNTYAAKISVVSDTPVVADNTFIVKLFIDTQYDTINTVSGTLVYNSENLEIVSINPGNSLVTFWVTPPEKTTTGSVDFAGIIPGGIQTQNGFLFSLVFSPRQKGISEITVTQPQVLLHDGLGTTVSTEVSVQKIDHGINQNKQIKVFIQDTQKPENFVIYRTQTSALFDNQWFITFASQDKGSGIHHYRVCELVIYNCTDAQSPYMLKNQSNWYWVSVHAVDGAGNTKISILISQNTQITLFSLLLLGILYIFYVYIQSKQKKS